MKELMALEILIIVLVVLYILRPFLKQFQGVDGVFALPIFTLFASFALFLAYGFRPEFLPLFLFIVILCITGIPRLFDTWRRLRTNDYGEVSILKPLVGIVVLIACAWFSLAHLPPESAKPVTDASVIVTEWTVPASAGRVELRLRLYASRTPAEVDRPLVLLSPPLFRSFTAADTLCRDIARRGLPVLAFARPSLVLPQLDEKGKEHLPLSFRAVKLGYAWLLGEGRRVGAATDAQLEAERVEGFLSALAYIADPESEKPLASVSRTRILLAGFGTGGGAAARVTQETNDGRLLGYATIEGRIGSGAPQQLSASDARGSSLRKVGNAALRWLGLDRVGSYVRRPATRLAGLHLVSGDIRNTDKRDTVYAGLLASSLAATAPTALLSFDAAGPYDFSDLGTQYPVLNAGRSHTPGDAVSYKEKAAQAIVWFADLAAAHNAPSLEPATVAAGDAISVVAVAPKPVVSLKLPGCSFEMNPLWKSFGGTAIITP